MNSFKAAVIGLGKIGIMYDFDPKRETPASHVLAYKLNPDIGLIAAMDTRHEQMQYLQKVSPETKFYDDMIQMVRDTVFDIISICTLSSHHLIAIETIFQVAQPRIIFCEKPVVNGLEEARKLRELLKNRTCMLIPNLSRRWNTGINQVREAILQGKYGSLEKINVRYTRGIYNTGSHFIDLLRFFAGDIESVQVINRVQTSSDVEGEPSFSFTFKMVSGVTGFAEAFNDQYYYMFEIDLYFEYGKIEIRMSGDEINYYCTVDHPLFSGFGSLHLEHTDQGLLRESNLKNAVNHLVKVLRDEEKPICTIEDGIYPLYVADALVRSYKNNGSREQVVVECDE